MSYTTKPIELPLSTEKEYVLVDVLGWEMSYPGNSQYTELMKVPFSFNKVGDKAAYIDGDFGVNISDFEEYRFLEEVIRQPQTNEFNTDSIAVTEQEEEEFKAMVNNSEIPNSSEWKTGDACSYYYLEGKEWRDGVYVIQDNGFHVIRDIEDDGYTGVTKKHLRKPETPEQREERELAELIDNAYDTIPDLSDVSVSQWVARALISKGYRK